MEHVENKFYFKLQNLIDDIDILLSKSGTRKEKMAKKLHMCRF